MRNVFPVRRGADLFCGAGGTSTGMMRAAERRQVRMDLLAVNHWPTAVNTHSLNHPTVRHLCEELDRIRPREAVPGGHLHVLAASPECTHHNNAAGGRPKNDQSRATAWHVCRWVADLRVDSLFIENVKEFTKWGPLNAKGKPIKRRAGETFNAFIQSLQSMDYRVEWRIQNACDFGDPTSRARFILLARKGGGVITWPEPTHGPATATPYRTAREVIDWSIKGRSIFQREKTLSPNTLRRIAAGLRKFGGPNAEPFLVMLYGTNKARSIDRPCPTVTSGGNHIALCEPFVMHATHHGQDASRCHSVDNPLPTVTGANRGEMCLVEPFVFQMDHTKSPDRVHPLTDPLPTVTTADAWGLCEPFIVKYYGTGGAVSVDEPLDTITAKDRFLLVSPSTGKTIAEIDIRYRMLQSHELSAAQGFPSDYQFTGNRGERVKQIGNAVPVGLAESHLAQLL